MGIPDHPVVSPEHADCNRSYYRRERPPGLPDGVAELDPKTALYAPRVSTIDGVEHRWWLLDVDEENRRHPKTFFVAPVEQRCRLPVGDSARLVFRFEPRGPQEPSGERIWVAVAGADQQGYAGYLTNQPFFVKGLNAGDVIGFDARHVASLEVTDADMGFSIEAQAFVSLRVARGGEPGYLVLDPPERRRSPQDDEHGWELVDSGWQVLVGDETEEELADPASVVLWELGWLAERCPMVVRLLRSGEVSGRWLWSAERKHYERIR